MLCFFICLRIVSPRHILMEMEPTPTDYTSLFSHSFREQIISLLLKIAKSLFALTSDLPNERNENNTGNSPTGVLSGIFNQLFNDASTSRLTKNQTTDLSKTKNYLES